MIHDTDRSPLRRHSAIDRLIQGFDQALRASLGETAAARRPDPAASAQSEPDLSAAERKHAGGLMRVNHTGEVCAQALYAGQALTARNDIVKTAMQEAADEELDHLAWCQKRLDALHTRPSLLNPLWYAGSFAIGAAAGLTGDRWSLGFLKETERQVEAHLADHLERLPEADVASQAVLAQMKIDEAEHAQMAQDAGAAELPYPIRGFMRSTSEIMKAVAYRI